MNTRKAMPLIKLNGANREVFVAHNGIETPVGSFIEATKICREINQGGEVLTLEKLRELENKFKAGIMEVTAEEFKAADVKLRGRILRELLNLSCNQTGKNQGQADAKRKPIDARRVEFEQIEKAEWDAMWARVNAQGKAA